MSPKRARRPLEDGTPEENLDPREEGQNEQNDSAVDEQPQSDDSNDCPEPEGPSADIEHGASPAEPAPDDTEEVRQYALDAARKAVARGWSFTPLKGKDAYKKGWQKAPTPPLAVVEQWLTQGNIGLRTGSASGVLVIDDDTADGSANVALDLPPTATVITGSGRRHLYFKNPEEQLGNGTGNLPDGLDVRGNGGQVVFVGSIHPGTGGIYRWAPGLSPDEIELAELPSNVLDLIRTRKVKREKARKEKKEAARKEKRRPSVAADDSARKALEDAAACVARASEGTRNKTLNAEAFRMGKWVNSGLVSRSEVEAALAAAARTAGLDDREAESTIRSALDAGCTKPFRYHTQSGAWSTAVQKPSITIEGGALPQIVTQAEDALLGATAPLFQRGNIIVRAMRAPAMTMRDLYRRAEGILMLCTVDSPFLVEILTSAANWYRMARDELVLIDCPERVARTYLARAGHWRLRSLLGVIETPTLRPDGSLLDKPGYDQDTALWFDPGGVEFPTIPAEPTREDALLALAVLVEVIKDFPWLEDSDKAAALAAILTALIRHSLRTAPMFAFRAPKMASGKSLLGDVVAMIATGRVCSVMSQGKDEDEDKKRMLAILVEGIAVACIDNIDRPFGGATLCSVLTQESWRERILGKTGTATVPTTTTWLATGNNIHFVGDIVTRVVPCDLDPRVEKPEERKFEVNLYEYVPKHRGALVAAGLTILRAFRVAGSPDQKLPVFGRFEEWSGWVRSALVWLGLPDPCAGRVRLYSQDPVGAQLRALLTAWHEKLGSKVHSAAAAITAASPDTPEGDARLYLAMIDVAVGQGGRADAKRLGNYLSTYERRTEVGLRIERVGERQGTVLWRVVRVDQPGSVGLEGFVGHFRPGADENETGDHRAKNGHDRPGGGVGPEDDDEHSNRSHRPPAGNNPPNPPNPPSRHAGFREGAVENPFDGRDDGEEEVEWKG